LLTSEDVPEPQSVLQQRSTSPIPIVPVQQPLTPQEIERMCKAFIKLLLAEETPTDGNSDTGITNIPA
jgi:hypothetical protein